MKKAKNKKGFSLMELMVSVFIFSLMMITVAMAFSSIFLGYRSSKSIQKDLENAQYGMSLMAKTLRTSGVASSSANYIRFYNYSEAKCSVYRLNGNVVQIASASDPGNSETNKKDWCQNRASFSSYSNLTAASINSLNFSVVETTSSVIGKVTISMEVGSGNDKDRIQSTVSFRDYEDAGL